MTTPRTPLMEDLRQARQLLQDVREWQTNDELLTFERQIVLVDQVERSLTALLARLDPPTPPPADDAEGHWTLTVLAELQKQRDVGIRQVGHVADFAVEQWQRGYYFSATVEFVTAFRLARAVRAFEEALASLLASTSTSEYALAIDDDAAEHYDACESCSTPITGQVVRTADDVPLCEPCAAELSAAEPPSRLDV